MAKRKLQPMLPVCPQCGGEFDPETTFDPEEGCDTCEGWERCDACEGHYLADDMATADLCRECHDGE